MRARPCRATCSRRPRSPAATRSIPRSSCEGASEDWDPLGSFFDTPERDAEDNGHVRRRIAQYSRRTLRGNVVMVTHAVNIASLTKRTVATAQIVVVRPDGCCGLRVLVRADADDCVELIHQSL